MKAFTRFLFYCAVVLTVCLVQNSAIADSRTDSAHSLKVGLNPWIGNGLFYIAKEKGFFDREKLDVELIKYNEGAIAKQLLSAAKIDVIPTTPETVLVLEDAGVKVKVVGILNTSKGADGIIATQKIKSISDLKGKTIAFEEGSSSHLLLSYFLEKNGLTLKDIKPYNLSASDSGAAFISGKVDAAVTWEPWLSKAAERKGGHILIDSRSMELFPDFYIFRANVVQEKPAAIQAMLRALFAAVQFVKEHPSDGVNIIAKNFHLTPSIAEAQLKTLKWLDYKENLHYFTSTKKPNAEQVLQEASNLWFKLGIIRHPIHAKELIDANLLKTLYSSEKKS
jgi:NitT/TauT family transport system substrate-binding protein